MVIFLDFAIDCAFSGNSGSSVKFVGEVPRRGEEDVEALSATLLIHLRSHCEVLQALPVVQRIVQKNQVLNTPRGGAEVVDGTLT